ncbi:MAG: DUF362 domain-containing protein [Acidobacteriota bacterium]
MMKQTRRAFLETTGLAAGALLTAPSLLSARPAPAGRVAIGMCPEYNRQVEATLATLFDQLGGLQKLVGGKTVAIKLNMTGTPRMRFQNMPVEMTHWVHPVVVAATVSLMGRAGARRIRLLESHPDGTASLQEFMASAGWDVNAIANAAQHVEFENTNYLAGHKAYARFMVPGHPLMYAGYETNPSYRDNDLMVSMAKLKDHRLAGVTLSMKNMFGSLPTTIYGMDAPADEPAPTAIAGNRAGMVHNGRRVPPKSAPAAIDVTSHDPHYRMPHVVPELVSARPVELAIIDGIHTMDGGELPSMRSGPGQTINHALHPGVLIAGLNPVNTDAVAVAVMGFNPRASRGEPPFELCDSMLEYAEKLGIGTRDLSRIEVAGTPVARARYPFKSVKQCMPT